MIKNCNQWTLLSLRHEGPSPCKSSVNVSLFHHNSVFQWGSSFHGPVQLTFFPLSGNLCGMPLPAVSIFPGLSFCFLLFILVMFHKLLRLLCSGRSGFSTLEVHHVPLQFSLYSDDPITILHEGSIHLKADKESLQRFNSVQLLGFPWSSTLLDKVFQQLFQFSDASMSNNFRKLFELPLDINNECAPASMAPVICALLLLRSYLPGTAEC